MADPSVPAVLVVHPDAGLRAEVADALRDRGYAVTTAPRAACPRGRPAVVVIDHRALPCSTPARILGLVPDHDDAAILAAFTAGAADVLAGPLRAAELASRVAVLARRTLGPPPLRVGPIAVDTEGRRVSLAGRPVELTRREYELLTRLATAPGRVFTKQELLRDVWADPSPSASRRLDTQVARLRRRLGPHRTLLVTVWGVGYRLGGR